MTRRTIAPQEDATTTASNEVVAESQSQQVMGPALQASTTKVFKGIRLNDVNYTTWAFQMKVHLRSIGLWSIVDSGVHQSEKDQDICLAEIVNNIDESQIMTVIECSTPQAAWKALESMHRAKTFSHLTYMKQDFFNKTFNVTDGMKKHLSDMKELALRLRLAGSNIEDGDLASTILISVKDKRYETTISSLTSGRAQAPTFDEISAALLLRELEIARGNTTKRECGFATYQQRRDTRKCFNCNQIGHISAKCRKPRRPRNAQRSETNQDARFAEEMGFSASTNHNGNVRQMICDSGATSHMTGDLNSMIRVTNVSPRNVVMADGRTIQATKSGSMRIQGTNGETIEITDVLYVPGLRDGLFSVGSACDTIADEVILTKTNCNVNLSGKTIISGERRGRHYLLNTSMESAQMASANVNWHQRLGHLNLQDLKRMKNDGLVKGMDNFHP